MKKKGNKKMPNKLILNPIPTSLFCLKFCLFVVKKKIFTSNWLHEIHCGKDVARDGGWAPERGDSPKGGVAALPTTSAGGNLGDCGS